MGTLSGGGTKTRRPFAHAFAMGFVLLLSSLPSLAIASEGAADPSAVQKRKSKSTTAGELMEMPPADRRGFIREAASEVPMPANFGSDELDAAQEQLSNQFHQGMADTLKVLSQTAGASTAALPPVPKPAPFFARGAANAFGGLSHAARFGIHPYGQLRRALEGTGLRAHHLIEQRFASLLGQDARQMLSIAVTPAEHQAFTNAWRQAIPYGQGTANATRQQVLDVARQLYSNQPEVLRALGL